MTERLYCSDASRLRGDDNAATASRVDVWILVELPATWGREPIRDAAIPNAVRAALTGASHRIPRSRVVFIRRRVEPQQTCNVFVVRSAPEIRVAHRELPSLDDVASLPFDTMAASEQRVLPRPLVLVCTHGQHDSCCGRRGYPLFDALRARDDLDVWQCSHIGGDRFAANAVVLPWGLYYGPVEPRDAGALAEATLRGEVFLPGFRGRASIGRPVQAAEIFVRRERGIVARDALHVVGRDDLAEHRTRITLRDDGGTTHVVTVEQSESDTPALLTCTAKIASAIPIFRVTDYEER